MIVIEILLALNFIAIMLLITSAKKDKKQWYSNDIKPKRIKGSCYSYDVLVMLENNKKLIGYYDYSNARWEYINYQIPLDKFRWRYIEIDYKE